MALVLRLEGVWVPELLAFGSRVKSQNRGLYWGINSHSHQRLQPCLVLHLSVSLGYSLTLTTMVSLHVFGHFTPPSTIGDSMCKAVLHIIPLTRILPGILRHKLDSAQEAMLQSLGRELEPQAPNGRAKI